MARIFLIHDDGREEGPYSVRDLRDRVALKMVDPRQPCRFRGEPGRYVAGEICSGNLFAELEAADPDGPDIDVDAWVEVGFEDEEIPPRAAARPMPAMDPDIDSTDTTLYPDPDFPTSPASSCLWSARPGFLFRMRATGWAVLLGAAAGAAAWLSWSGWIAAALASASCACLALAVCGGGRVVYRIFPTHVEVTRRGLGGKTTEVPMRRIEAVNVSRSGPAALLGFGSLHIEFLKPDGSPASLRWPGIHRPGRARDLLRRLRHPPQSGQDDE